MRRLLTAILAAGLPLAALGVPTPASNVQLNLTTNQQQLTSGQAIYANQFSIESFGAVGDGTTDCTAAFASAWAALQNAGGGTLTFGAGRTYLVNPTINTNWLTLTSVPVNLAFNGCTIHVGNTFTANSGNYIVMFLFYGCSPVRIGTVTINSEVMMALNQSNPDQTGIIGFGFLSTNTVGCVNVFAEPIYQTGGKACVEVFRNANGSGVVNPQPVSARSSGMVFSMINTAGVYYPLQLQHSGDAVTANIQDVLCFRPFFVFGVKQVHLNVHDTNHMGSAVIAAYDETTTEDGTTTRIPGTLTWITPASPPRAAAPPWVPMSFSRFKAQTPAISPISGSGRTSPITQPTPRLF